MVTQAEVIGILKEHGKLRPSQIREKLRLKSVPESSDSRVLDVEICRILKRLEEKGIVERKDKGHQNVVYRLEEDAKREIDRTMVESMISSAISNWEIAKVEMSKSELQKHVSEMRSEQMKENLQKAGFSTRRAIRGEEARFFLDNMVSWLSKSSQEFSIIMLQSRESARKKLSEGNMLKLLGEREKRDLIRGIFNMRANLGRSYPDADNIPIADSRFGEMCIILHWKPMPKLPKDQAPSEQYENERSIFLDWLRKFKGRSPDPNLLDYLGNMRESPRTTAKRRLKARDLSQNLSEIRELEKLHSEFDQKRTHYEGIYVKAI